MLLTISCTRNPADDLSYLLHKHPDKVQQIQLSNGVAHIFYPEVSSEKCTCALLLDIDSIGLVRNQKRPSGEGFTLEQYVNDRPYVASSFMSAAISKAFGTAMNSRCKDKPELVEISMPFEVKLSVAHVRGGEKLIKSLFEPLGYILDIEHHTLDERFPSWGESSYFTIILQHTIRLKELLTHLYVLIPVLDNDKHYWVGNEELQKLLEKGKGWLETHPMQELIVKRYLKHLPKLANEALLNLMKNEAEPEIEEEILEKEPKIRLHDVRLETVCEELLEMEVKTIADIGCGEGKFLKLLVKQKQFQRIVGMDVSWRAIEIAKEKLNFDKLPERELQRINLFQGSLTYQDKRLIGFDAVTLVEVIEHLDTEKLKTLERVLFEFAKPKFIIVTTPNKDWNITFTEDALQMRHSDHRFEWTRAEFLAWCQQIKNKFAYDFVIKNIGEEMENIGSASQMVIFNQI